MRAEGMEDPFACRRPQLSWRLGQQGLRVIRVGLAGAVKGWKMASATVTLAETSEPLFGEAQCA
jgi:hypothetical protein